MPPLRPAAPLLSALLGLGACAPPAPGAKPGGAAGADGGDSADSADGSGSADGAGGADGADGSGGGDGSDGGGVVDPPLGVDLIRYLPDGAGLQLRDGLRLSDGSFLLVGRADHLGWVPEGAATVELDPLGTDSEAPGYALMVQLSADLGEVLAVAHFPEGTVEELGRVRDTAPRGQPTGLLTISGRRAVSDWERDGYLIARLDNNFVDGLPTRLEWLVDVSAKPRNAAGRSGQSAYEELQPWDVNADGEVYYGLGSEYDYDWAALQKLHSDGRPAVVEGWPAHWKGAGGEHHGAASAYTGADGLLHSAVVLKTGRLGSLRSTTDDDHALLQADGNGRADRQGRFPDDYFFSGPCTPGGDCAGTGGSTGYRPSDKPTQRLGAVEVDRRTGEVYLGLSVQSVLPDGNPDFEPAVVALRADGSLKWWSRLYEQTDANSSPDQYVDGLAFDEARDRLVVLARCHGNNVVNLWEGDEIAATPGASGHQNRFTGSEGNIHISWLGSFAAADGALLHSTYVAELADGATGLGDPDPDPNLAGFPDPNDGWPTLNTTRCEGGLRLDAEGRPAVSCAGRRTLTTAGAAQRMLLPAEGSSTWNSFFRLYAADLSTVVYSSLLVGAWDPADGAGGGNTAPRRVIPVAGGLLALADHTDGDDGLPEGNPVPTTADGPAWTATAPSPGGGLLAHFHLD